MGVPLHLLIVEDSEDDTVLMIQAFRRGGYDPFFERVDTAEAMTAALYRRRWEVVLSDYAMPYFSMPAALALLKKEGLDLPFIIVSGTIGEEAAVAAMKTGAHDYIMKGNLTRLIPAVEREIKEAKERENRRRAEEALAEERSRIEEEKLKASKIESMGVLAGGIAHDFNNILTAILGNLTLAKLHADPQSDLFKRLTEAEKASHRAKELSHQLLTFAKGGAPVKRMTSLTDLLRDSSAFALRGSSVRCDYAIAEGLWPVEIDEGQIGQVIQNLVINARQAMPDGGVIRIEAENVPKGTDPEGDLLSKEGPSVRISIRDFGSGIPKEHLGKIFDPYFTTKEKGSGLGLSTAYSIMKRHGGAISAASEAGVGTTFFLTLPAFPGVSPAEKIGKKGMVHGAGKILVMDDDRNVWEVAGAMLRRIGYTVVFARDGAEAVALYRGAKESGRPFDAVIMDLIIPGGMGGAEAIGKLAQIDPGVKAIVSSGYSNDPIMAEPGRYGFSGVLAKPYGIEELSHVLNQVVEKKN